MQYYECKRCFHITKQKIEMTRHINRKIKCSRHIKSYKYNEEDLEKLSLQIIKNNEEDLEKLSLQIIKNNEEDLEKLSLQIIKNNEEDPEKLSLQIIKNNLDTDDEDEDVEEVTTLESFNNIPILNCNICNTCNKSFAKKYNLLRHYERNKCKNIIINNNNNNNTIIINLNINKPIPFDSDWDTSNIDDKLKNILILSELKYTKTLEHILENKLNLNVILEDKAINGIVYKNDTEKFKLMNIDDIINMSMDKLHKQLNIFHNDVKTNNVYGINNILLDTEKRYLDTKFYNYKNEENTKLLVKKYISDIYNKKKDITVDYCKDLLHLDIAKIDGY